MSWSDRLPEPVILSSGMCLRTLHDAKIYLMKLPRPVEAEKHRILQDAIEALLRAGENEASILHGHIGLMRVLGRGASPPQTNYGPFVGDLSAQSASSP